MKKLFRTVLFLGQDEVEVIYCAMLFYWCGCCCCCCCGCCVMIWTIAHDRCGWWWWWFWWSVEVARVLIFQLLSGTGTDSRRWTASVHWHVWRLRVGRLLGATCVVVMIIAWCCLVPEGRQENWRKQELGRLGQGWARKRLSGWGGCRGDGFRQQVGTKTPQPQREKEGGGTNV
jgi:hypothetical protein